MHAAHIYTKKNENLASTRASMERLSYGQTTRRSYQDDGLKVAELSGWLDDAEQGRASSRAAGVRGASVGGALVGGALIWGVLIGDSSVGGALIRGVLVGGALIWGVLIGSSSVGGALLRGALIGGAGVGSARIGGALVRDALIWCALVGGVLIGGAGVGDAGVRGTSVGDAAPGVRTVSTMWRTPPQDMRSAVSTVTVLSPAVNDTEASPRDTVRVAPPRVVTVRPSERSAALKAPSMTCRPTTCMPHKPPVNGTLLKKKQRKKNKIGHHARPRRASATACKGPDASMRYKMRCTTPRRTPSMQVQVAADIFFLSAD